MTFERRVKGDPAPCRIKSRFVCVPLALLDIVSTKALVLYLRAACLGGFRSSGYFESQETIATYLGISDRAVRSLIKELLKAGAVFKDGHSGQGPFLDTTILRCRRIEGDFQTIPAAFLDHIGIGGDPRRLRLGVLLAKKVRGSQAILTRAQLARESRISKNEITRLLIELVEAEWVTIQDLGRRLLIQPGVVMDALHRKVERPSQLGTMLSLDHACESPRGVGQPPSNFRANSLDLPGDLPHTSGNSKPHDLKPLDSYNEGSGHGQILHEVAEEDVKSFKLIADLCHRSIPGEWWADGVDSRWHAASHPRTVAAVATVLNGSCVSAEEINDRVFLPLSIWIRLNGCAKDMQVMRTPALIASIIKRFHVSGAVMSETHLRCPVYWHEAISFDRAYTTIGDCLEEFLDDVMLLHDAKQGFGSAMPEWLGLAVLETRAAYEGGFVGPAHDDWHDLMGFPLDEEESSVGA